MATCGYICPSCNGTGYHEDGIICTWCAPTKKIEVKELTEEEWMKAVHEGPCCSGEPENNND